MRRVLHLMPSVVAAVLLVTFASGGLGSTEPASPASGETSGAVPSKLVGRWSRNITQADWARYGQSFPVGIWSFVVSKNGSVGVIYPRTSYVDFTTGFAISGGRLTIDAIPICPGAKGRYTWKMTGKRLTLKAVADRSCKPRAALFTGVWKKK